MPSYKQTVKFERVFHILAKDAAEANEKLENAVREIEWDSDVESQGFYEFEDEPVECPECKGDCEVDEKPCVKCNGEGSIPFVSEP